MTISAYKLILTCLGIFAWGGMLKAQPHSFYHISTSHGLTENNVRSVAIDRNGFLWVGTIDGLNVYDGYQVQSFRREDHPEMASNNIIHLTCDSRNRIWMGTPEGVTWIDETRKMHRVALNDSIKRFGCRTIQDTKTYGPVVYTSLGQYFFNEKTGDWEKLDWIPREIQYNRFHDAEPYDENNIIYATDSLVMVMDYARKKVVFSTPFLSVFSLCRYRNNQLAIGLQQGEVQILDIGTNRIIKTYHLTSELNNKKVNSTLTEVRLAPNGHLLVGTAHNGLAIIDTNGRITNYKHDPINPRSIGANLTWRVLSNKNGDIIVGTNNAGVSVFNIHNQQAGYINLFSDGKGNFYDSYVSKMAEDREGVIWIAALERLIRWDRQNNKTTFYYYDTPPLSGGVQNLEIRSVCVDQSGRIWISALGDGVAVLDKASGKFTRIYRDSSLGPAVKNDNVLDLYTASDGMIWAGSSGGAYMIDPGKLSVRSFKDHPVLSVLQGTRVNSFLEDRKGVMWMATTKGIYGFNSKENLMVHYGSEEGLATNQCVTLFIDRNGRLYTGTAKGFSIIEGNNIKNYDRSKGLRYSGCEGITQDTEGKIWVANAKCLIRFNPVNGDMQFFDENSGLTTEGYRMGSYLRTRSGELLWGSRSGINYFFPNELVNHQTDLRVLVYGAVTGDSLSYFGSNHNIPLNYKDNKIIFRFTAINLKGSRNIEYQYQLEGYDKEWQTGRDLREARYSALQPGSYTFRLRASMDGKRWVNAANLVTLDIIPPIWQRWWFLAFAVLLVAFLIFRVIRYRNQQIQEQQEELETEQAINYFASSMYEQHTVDMILWDVAKNCIGRLHFEDCVIYLLDEEKNVLVQKAAHGPKSPRQFEIDKPINIPLGKGIVGSVAASGRAEIIPDTTKDPRYIVDDEQRYSEISVPIISGDKVLGVIDCEHSKKNFFTPRHLSILTTIASLCANKITRARAEEEKERAQLVLMDTQRKMTEVEMQALRAQMNPHFIFNCLNSINRYIVKSDQVTASFYLTKFAKLIRLILDNSNTKNVMLSHELEALKLYIEMESLRFDKKFQYRIQVGQNVQADCIEVPPLIIQPYVENAIWHGLLHKNGPGCLLITINMPEENMLECIIEDDGVGRDKARELKSKSATTRKSLGLKLTENRLNLLNKYAELNASIDIIDLVKTNNEAAGTKVILKIPI